MKIKKLNKGFTLIELMIVITVIAILAAIVLFGLGQAQKAARDVQRESIIKGVQVAMQSYAGNNGGSYPTGTDWATITGNGAGTGLSTTYLTSALTDPGCGAASGGDMRADANGEPAGCAAGVVIYDYNSSGLNVKCTGAAYEILLTKESGGVGIFCGPK